MDNYVHHASLSLLARKPRLISKLIRLYGTYMLSSRTDLRIVDLALTKACPYRCPHCYPEDFYNEDKTPLSVEEIHAVMRQAGCMGVVQFNFQGGEPTVDLDRLEKVLAGINPWGHYVTLSTNGFRHKPDELQRIYSMGVDKIAVSLHSGFPEEHDTFVGFVGAYNRVMDCLVHGPEAGLEVTLSLVVSRNTIRSKGIRKVINLCIEKGIILDINIATPVGRWSGLKEVLPKDEDLEWLDKLNHKHTNIRRDIHPHLFRTGCPAAKEVLYVDLFGDVLACPFLHFSLGNVRTDSLEEMRNKALTNTLFANHHPCCLATEDSTFIEKYMTKTFTAVHTPILWEEAFGAEHD